MTRILIRKYSKYPKLLCLERRLEKLDGRRIALPCETRWCSYRDSYCCCIKNLSSIQKIVEKEEFEVKQGVINLILDKYFEHNFLTFPIFFYGICALINKNQQGDINIVDAVQEWLNLQLTLCNKSYYFFWSNIFRKC